MIWLTMNTDHHEWAALAVRKLLARALHALAKQFETAARGYR